ncbi:MAG: YjzC family protein [Myxococcales bacterium]|nr:YjzC family protein [Myxococcales bacterium]
MGIKQKPGETPKKAGEYVERGPQGGKVPHPRKVTIEPRDPKMPPTQKPGRQWERIGPPKP